MSARRMESLVPAAGHLVHMPAHIYMRTGNYEGAVKSNADAAAIDREFIRSHGPDGVYPLMYYNHNVSFLSAAESMAGNFAGALKSAEELRGQYRAIRTRNGHDRTLYRHSRSRSRPIQKVGRDSENDRTSLRSGVQHVVALCPRDGKQYAELRKITGSAHCSKAPARLRSCSTTSCGIAVVFLLFALSDGTLVALTLWALATTKRS